nr:unnamed protein product [Digitaria exilis]CAB3488192.1 unnamed protein product [Digitaria exilis]
MQELFPSEQETAGTETRASGLRGGEWNTSAYLERNARHVAPLGRRLVRVLRFIFPPRRRDSARAVAEWGRWRRWGCEVMREQARSAAGGGEADREEELGRGERIKGGRGGERWRREKIMERE